MNKSELAKAITLREGLKVSLTIAQVKEVLRIQGDLLGEDPKALDCLYVGKKRTVAQREDSGKVTRRRLGGK